MNTENNLKPYGIIYRITNNINGKIYIGQTARNLKDRFWEHVSNKTHKCYIDRAIKKYGRNNFSIEEIDLAKSEEELNKKEIFWISFYNSTNKNIGYNLTIGGESGIVPTERRIERAKSLIKCVESNEIFISTVDAARYKKLTASSISGALNGKNLSSGGLNWIRVEKTKKNINSIIFVDRRLPYISEKNLLFKKIKQLETGIVYDSIRKAAKENNINERHLHFVLKNKCGRCKGMTYMRIDN